MRGRTSGDKSFLVLKSELSEVAEAYGATAEELVEIHKQCWEHDEEYQWERICLANPEFRDVKQYDKERILELLSRIRGGQKKSKEEVVRT